VTRLLLVEGSSRSAFRRAVRLRARVFTSSADASREEQPGFCSRVLYPIDPHDKGSRGKQLTYPLCE